jgi:hypothetical protein
MSPVGGQSAFVQQSAFAMHVLLQTLFPAAHSQVPPEPVLPTQVSPVTVQLLLLQHVVLGMHEFVVAQTLSPEAHSQVPPVPVLPTQVSPAMAVQLLLSQQVPTVMQELEVPQ